MKILREYDWNSHRYAVVQKDDGTTIEVKDQSDPISCVKNRVEPAATVAMATVATISNEELLAEVGKRRLTVSVKGRAL